MIHDGLKAKSMATATPFQHREVGTVRHDATIFEQRPAIIEVGCAGGHLAGTGTTIDQPQRGDEYRAKGGNVVAERHRAEPVSLSRNPATFSSRGISVSMAESPFCQYPSGFGQGIVNWSPRRTYLYRKTTNQIDAMI